VRTDYPNPDPEWARKNLIAIKDGDTVKITTRSVPEMPPELARLFEETK